MSTIEDDSAAILLTADGGNAVHLLQSNNNIAVDRHMGQYCCCFVDGHVEVRKADQPATLILPPPPAHK